MDQTLFNDQNENIVKNGFFLYTNNNNLRHFLSGDRIVSKNLFETDKYDSDLATFYDNFLLLSKNTISSNLLSQFKLSSSSDTVYPIVLKVNFELEKKVQALLIKNDFSIEKSTLDNFDVDKHSFALVYGFIPYQFTENVIFNNENNKLDFLSLKHSISNITYFDDQYIVDPECFKGNLELSLNDLEKLKENLPSEDSININENLLKNNKIRGFYHCFLEGLKITNDSLSINFDEISFKIYSDTIKTKKYNPSTDFNETIDKLSKYIISIGGFTAINTDSIAFDHLLYQVPLTETLEASLKENKLPKINSSIKDVTLIYDIFSFQLTLYLLINSESFHFRPKDFLAEFKKQILDFTPDDIKDSSLVEIDTLKDKYSNIISTIESIQRGIGPKITEVFKKIPENFTTLKSLIFLLLNYQSEKFNDLVSKLGKFDLTPIEKRIILSFYGSLNGIRPLSVNFKKNIDTLRLSDIIANTFIQSKMPISDYYKINKGYKKSNVKISETQKDKEKLTTHLRITNGLGISFRAVYRESIELLRIKILSLITDRKFNSIKQFFFHKPESNNYCKWIIRTPSKIKYSVSIDSNFQEFTFDKEVKIVKEWGNWDGFVKEFIDDSMMFKKIVNKDTFSQLKSIIAHSGQ